MKQGQGTDIKQRQRRRRHSKLSLLMTVFFLQSTTATLKRRDGWRPDAESTGTPFRLGDGKAEGVKVVGYQGEWPLWSDFRAQQIHLDQPTGPSSSTSTSAQPALGTGPNSNAGAVFVCMTVGECSACPSDVLHYPYCRPYNNRRRVACQQVSNPADAASVQLALSQAPSSSVTGWEACGKSPKAEAQDYFQLIAWMAGVALASIYIFVRRQKVLFERQTEQLQSRVSGHRRRATVYN